MMTRADWTALILAAALLPVLYAHYWHSEGPAAEVRITANGQPEITLPLTGKRRFAVHGPLGDSVIEIRDGRVRFVSSPCNGQQCVHSGWLAHAGELAACLPNGIVVSILGRDRHYDSINF
jgi:hypothetical protein